MKQLAAILLLTVLLINIVGYRGWFYLAESRWDKQIEHSLDNDQFNEEDLILIKAPLNLPYVTDTKDFVRIDGEITVNGKIYRYVKSKIENGNYVLLCLPDHYKEKLQQAKHDYFTDANDILNNKEKSSGSKAGTMKCLLSEYDQLQSRFCFLRLFDIQLHKSFDEIAALSSSPHISPEQPPDSLL